jgi:hypothetical protein
MFGRVLQTGDCAGLVIGKTLEIAGLNRLAL